MFETGVVRANECYSLRQVRRHNRDTFSIFFNMVCCVFSLDSPHRGDSNEYTQYILFSIYKGASRVVRWCWVNFQCWGVLLLWVLRVIGQVPTALAVGAGGVVRPVFFRLSFLFFLPLSGPI